MKFYLAGKYSSHPEMRERVVVLKFYGHSVTSRWITGDHEHLEGRDKDPENARFAREDIEDIMDCNAVIWFSEPQNNGRGGRHVEFGYALAIQRPIYVIGRKENVFHHYTLSPIKHFETWDEFLDWLPIPKST